MIAGKREEWSTTRADGVSAVEVSVYEASTGYTVDAVLLLLWVEGISREKHGQSWIV